MPVVLTVAGFQVHIYLPPREHEPPHVHVVKGGTEVVVTLANPPQVREVRRMSNRDAVRAYRIVSDHRAMLLAEWRRYHG